MSYRLLKQILFHLDPEKSHAIAMQSLALAYRLKLLNLIKQPGAKPRTVMGLNFQNPVGLAAGLDKNAEYVAPLAALGFGFIEIGTVTPLPQSGNPRPRLFRLKDEEAIINRMGFNSDGVEQVVNNLENTAYAGILGINIGKNKETPIINAVDDYLFGFRSLAKYASYFTINISSPNTAGLRDLQQGELLTELLAALKHAQSKYYQAENKYVPIAVKISPDLSTEELHTLAQVLLAQHIDGVIATNTTIHRDGVERSSFASELGGLSGRPLAMRSTATIKQLHLLLQNKIPIIASGGVMDAASAREKIAAGAKLVQVYTGFIYRGPGMINEMVMDLQDL